MSIPLFGIIAPNRKKQIA